MASKKSGKPPVLPGATHGAKVHGPACGDSLELYLRVEGGVLREARFLAQACRATKNLAAKAVEKASGAKESEIFSWSLELLRSWETGEAQSKAHAADLVLEAFHEALRSGRLAK